MFPPHYILAREAAGWSMRDPWTTHGGAADYLAVECPAMLDHYRREGIPQSKLHVVGSTYCDVVADALAEQPRYAEARRRRTKIAAGRTGILIALPPSYHETRPGTNEFKSYEDMCRNIVDACRALPATDCTLSIHPATPPEQRSMLEAFGLPVSTEWILKLIPRHDILLTTFSSVTRWAVACGKPVFNYDAYAFNLRVYDGFPTVLTRRSLADLAAELERATDDDEYGRLAARNGNDERWGPLDGADTRRILEFITQAAARRALKPVSRFLSIFSGRRSTAA
jgi:hypothetical protein